MRALTQEEAPGLEAGDVVELEGERYELLCSPFVGRAGGSVFDDFRVFWRARIRSLSDADDVRVGTWWSEPPRRAA